ncbi:hypothetical protein [Actinoallomurus sp. NPDC050550]|uniref:hypothetical protein n=1 Tax=Actinoallomurus sp. NPDC050550 TaxID=3154937 RepID=UPI0033DC3029
MRRLLAVSTAVAAGAFAVPAVAYAYTSGKLPTCTATFTNHPENSSPPWALDAFTRTTTFAPGSTDGTWTVHIRDAGHFTTVPGTKSDSGDTIVNKVKGRFNGSGDYTVTSTTAPHCVDGEQYDGTADPSTGQWPLHYFDKAATTTGINPWRWVYRTYCERMVEDSQYAHVQGSIAGKDCPQPTPTPTPTPTADSPEPSPSDSDPEPSPSDTTSSPASEAPAASPVTKQPKFTG